LDGNRIVGGSSGGLLLQSFDFGRLRRLPKKKESDFIKRNNKLAKAGLAIALIAMAALSFTAMAQENTAEDWFKKGQELDRNGSYNESIQAYYKALNLTNETLKKNSKDAEAWQINGLVLERLYRIDEAAIAFGKVVELDPRNAEAWLHKGKIFDMSAYGLQGQERTNAFEDAIKAYDKAIEINPNYGEAWENKGYSLGSLAGFNKNLSEYNESLKAFDKAIELIPSNDTRNLALAWDGRAITLTGMGNTLEDAGLQEEAKGRREEAVNDYSKAIELGPSFAGLEAQLYRAGILADLGRYNESLAAYDNAIEAKPNYPPDDYSMYVGLILADKGSVLEKIGNHEEALKTFDKAIESFPENAQSWKGKGDALNSIGRYDEAVKAYDKALELIPQPGLLSAYSWHGKGLALKALGRSSEADASFAKAKELEALTVTVVQENTAGYWLEKGNELSANGFNEQAVKAFDKAISLDPKNASTWLSKGEALINLALVENEEFDDAIKAFDKAIEINPRYAEAWFKKGDTFLFIALTKHEPDKYNESIKSLDNAIEINPTYVEAWVSKGSVLLAQQKYADAVRALDNAIDIDPKNRGAWISKADALANLHKYNESLEAYNKAIENTRTNSTNELASIWFQKSKVLLMSGKTDEAQNASDKVIELDPKFAPAWHNKGTALKKLSRNSEAEEAFAKAKELGYLG